MFWIPKFEKYTLFQRGCEYPMPPPPPEEAINRNSTGDIFGAMIHHGENFKALYDRFKNEGK